MIRGRKKNMLRKKKNILVVDDEPKIVEVVSSFLESRGYHIFTAENGYRALEIFNQENIALVVLDLMMPDISGEEVCQIIRKKSRIPIIMLTAKSDENHLIKGLGLGADDYITKPFSLKELHARMEAVLRRSDSDLPLVVKHSWNGGDLFIDFEKNIIKKRQKSISLTPNEFKLLSTLIKYSGKVFTRTELIEIALGSEFDGYDRTIDTHIKNLRQKLEDNPRSPVYILTIHGFGYKFKGE